MQIFENSIALSGGETFRKERNTDVPKKTTEERKEGNASEAGVKLESTFRLTENWKQLRESQPRNSEEEICAGADNCETKGRDFGEVEVVEALKDYGNIETKDPILKFALLCYPPEVAGEDITLYLSNNTQVDIVERNKKSIMAFLNRRLRSHSVSLNTKIRESEEEVSMVTLSQKLNYFMELNPAVKELKEKFGLEFD